MHSNREKFEFYTVDQKALPYSVVIKVDTSDSFEMVQKLYDIIYELKTNNFIGQKTVMGSNYTVQIIRPSWIVDKT